MLFGLIPVSFVLIWLLVMLLACPICSAIVAGTKHREPSGWFLLGLVFGPFGLLAAIGASKLEDVTIRDTRLGYKTSMKICGYCAEPVRSEATRCSHCTSTLPALVKAKG